MFERKTVLAITVALLALFPCGRAWSAETYTQAELAEQRREYIVALFAKLLCSGVFVVGRDADEFIANDLSRGAGPGIPTWDEIEVDVDRENDRVTLSVDGAPPRTAVYHGDQGCTLLTAGETAVHFTPVTIESPSPDPATQDWPMGDRLPAGFPDVVDVDALNRALDRAFDDTLNRVPQKTRAMVVVYRGRIVGERYAEGFDINTRHISWSMGKSITAALVGIPVGDGHFAVTDPAPIPEWQGADDPRSAIRIAHLLRMSGGLDFDTGSLGDGTIYTELDHHRYVYFGAPNVFSYSIERPLAFEPGDTWRYRNCDPLALGKIVRATVEAEGGAYNRFPYDALFHRIGMRNMVLEVDPWGNFIMTGFDYGTARDWARFGLLHLWDGVWQGERILPEGWVDFVRAPAPAHPGKGYGGLFWLNAGGRFGTLPEDLFWPAGHMGQVCMISPSRDLVVVRLGHSAEGGFDPYIERVMGEIFAAIEPRNAQ